MGGIGAEGTTRAPSATLPQDYRTQDYSTQNYRRLMPSVDGSTLVTPASYISQPNIEAA